MLRMPQGIAEMRLRSHFKGVGRRLPWGRDPFPLTNGLPLPILLLVASLDYQVRCKAAKNERDLDDI